TSICRALEVAGGSQYLVGMSRHPYLRPDPDDAAGRVNEEGLAHDAPKFATVQRFLAPCPVGRERLFGFVGSKGYGEFMFGFEFVLCAHGVGRNAENRRARFCEFGTQAGEREGLLGTTGCVGPRVEVKDEVAAFEIP